MASTAFLTVTVTIFFFAAATPVLSYDDRNTQVCLAPGQAGYFNYACSNGTLPDATSSSSGVQVKVLTFAGQKLYDAYQQGYFDACNDGTFDDGAGGSETTSFSVYAGCGHGLDSVRCQDCVRDATLVVYGYCLGAVGAQAVSESCCVRYERDYKIC